MAEDLTNRYDRQKELVPADRIAEKLVTVVGVGAIGRQVALQLAAIGVHKVQLIDFDTVEVENLAAQGFLEEDLGKPKVEAVADMMLKINSDVEVIPMNRRFSRALDAGELVFACVDDIEVRQLIWESVSGTCELFADARMSAEVIRIITASDEDSHKYYGKTLFAAEEAYQDSCTAKSTIYCSNIAAGLLLEQLSKFLRGMPMDKDIQYNLLSMEMVFNMSEEEESASESDASPFDNPVHEDAEEAIDDVPF